MPNPLQDRIRAAMTGGGNLNLEFSVDLNARPPGSLQVYLHEIQNGVRVDLSSPGEAATIQWLPWQQGALTVLRPPSASVPPNTLFLTYYLSGCKVFAIRGGPVWHIDAPVAVDEFWPEILSDEWVEDNWPAGTPQDVAYLHRAGQAPALWDLSAHLQGGAPNTYGAGNVGQAIVGGVVNGNHQIDLYFMTSPWSRLGYARQVRGK
jgi:hypothetical protein